MCHFGKMILSDVSKLRILRLNHPGSHPGQCVRTRRRRGEGTQRGQGVRWGQQQRAEVAAMARGTRRASREPPPCGQCQWPGPHLPSARWGCGSAQVGLGHLVSSHSFCSRRNQGAAWLGVGAHSLPLAVVTVTRPPWGRRPRDFSARLSFPPLLSIT